MSSSTPRPFSLHIYLPNGTPEGIRLLDKSMWTGRGVYFPRTLFNEAKQREEFSQPGVYVLVGAQDDGGLPKIYIGQAEAIGLRLQSHYANKDFWDWAVFFVSKDGSLNRAHAQYLEARLVDLAMKAKRASLDNGNAPKPPQLAEWEEADVEGFLADMLSILPLVGLRVFEQPSRPAKRRPFLVLQAKGIEAKGYEAADGFVVVKGSQVVKSEVKSVQKYTSILRADLRQQGVIEDVGGAWVFSQDYTFNSPSSAAGAVLGRSSNGRTEWKDTSGRTLREIQEAASMSGAE